MLRWQGVKAIQIWMAFSYLSMAYGTNVYIDGFNLYYAIKRTPFKWLDISALCTELLPRRRINKIKYFTAIVKDRLHDPTATVRQGVYLRALRTIPNLRIHDEGHFVDRKRLFPQYPYAYRPPSNPTNPPQAVQVMKTEEKGSDVNLASVLLFDGLKDDYLDAVVISNDADLATPIKIVTQKLGKLVTVINPHKEQYRSNELINAATTYIWTINRSVYQRSQFPTTMSDSQGTFTKPSTWEYYYCHKCQRDVKRGQAFCIKCGARLTW